MTFELSSSAFANAADIPKKYTCDGDDVSPPLTWTGIPDGTRSLALIVDDPDAPDPAAPKTIWVHWVVVDLPPECSGLVEAVGNADLPGAARDGQNDWKRTGYGGPCPPVGRHRYFFKLYALDVELPELQQPTRHELEQAMQAHVLADATLIGTYSRGR